MKNDRNKDRYEHRGGPQDWNCLIKMENGF